MWIIVPENTKQLKTPELDEAVDLSGGTKVQVTKEVGETLVEHCDGIQHSE